MPPKRYSGITSPGFGGGTTVIPAGVIAHGRSVTAAGVDNILVSDFFLDYDATAGNQTPTLPTLTTNRGRWIRVKRLATDVSANTVIITPQGGQTIDGAANLPLLASQAVDLYAPPSGTSWLVY